MIKTRLAIIDPTRVESIRVLKMSNLFELDTRGYNVIAYVRKDISSVSEIEEIKLDEYLVSEKLSIENCLSLAEAELIRIFDTLEQALKSQKP